MLTANSAFGNADASWLAIPKSKVVFGCAAILASADYDREQSVVFYEISSLESAHGASNSLTPFILKVM